MTPEEYIALCGYPRDQKLMSHNAAILAKERGEKMKRGRFPERYADDARPSPDSSAPSAASTPSATGQAVEITGED